MHSLRAFLFKNTSVCDRIPPRVVVRLSPDIPSHLYPGNPCLAAVPGLLKVTEQVFKHSAESRTRFSSCAVNTLHIIKQKTTKPELLMLA